MCDSPKSLRYLYLNSPHITSQRSTPSWVSKRRKQQCFQVQVQTQSQLWSCCSWQWARSIKHYASHAWTGATEQPILARLCVHKMTTTAISTAHSTILTPTRSTKVQAVTSWDESQEYLHPSLQRSNKGVTTNIILTCYLQYGLKEK